MRAIREHLSRGAVYLPSRLIAIGNFATQILKHSINRVGEEAITFLSTYERFIHADVMTHRWSRNASSSRAIPYEKMREWIMKDPALPVHLGANRSGMACGLVVDDVEIVRQRLLKLLDTIYDECNILFSEYDLHKEILNRYTEAFGWITSIQTMGRRQLMNYFKLRIHDMATPNLQRCAVNQARLYRESIPQHLKRDQWHVPFIDDRIPFGCVGQPEVDEALKWAVARAAWCSYNNPTKDATDALAEIRHDRCVDDLHVTPTEHQLRARNDRRMTGLVPGYDSYRMMIPEESAEEFDFNLLDTKYAVRDFCVPPVAA